MCISCRQPVRPRLQHIAEVQSALLAEEPSFRNLELSFIDSEWFETFQKLPGRAEVEFPVSRFNAKEKTTSCRQGEARHVEKRVIGRRQAVHCQHAEGRRERGTKNGELECDGNKRRPTVEWLAVHIQRETQHIRVPLHKKSD